MSTTQAPSRTISEIDDQIRKLAQRNGALEAEIGRWLLIARRENVHAKLGFASFVEYVERRFGYTPRQVQELLRMAMRLERLPRIKADHEAGKLNASVVRELTRVATPKTEDVWAAASDGLSAREVEKLVAGRRKGDIPSTPRDPLLEMKRMLLVLPPEVHAIGIEAFELIRRKLGGHATNADVFRAMCEAVLAEGRVTDKEAAYQVGVTICALCQRTWRHAGGDARDVPDAVGACALCDGELAGLVEINDPIPAADAEPTHVGPPAEAETPPLGEAPVAEELTDVGQEAPATRSAPAAPAERVTHVGQEAPTSCHEGCVHTLIKRGGVAAVLRQVSFVLGIDYKAVSPRVRGFVLARDHHRCAVPGCRNHLWIEIHHLIRPEDGGPHTPENLVCLCSVHHRLFHDGCLAIEGTPSTGLTFRHPGGVLYGDIPERACA